MPPSANDSGIWGARGPTERPRHVVIVGGGRVGTAVADRLPAAWTLVVVDTSPAVEAAIGHVRPDARFVLGDGASPAILEQCGLTAGSVLIAATSSDLANRATARMARSRFGVEEVVAVTQDSAMVLEAGEKPGDFLVPADAVAGRVINRVSIEASRAVDVGLGAGEILQVTVLEGSPAIGRPLKEFGARHWLVAAIYRADQLIVPHGNTKVEAGDRVLLVGEPEDLQHIAPTFRGGAPVFPSQYGERIAWVGAGAAPPFATWFANLADADSLVEAPLRLRELADTPVADWVGWIDEECVGCVLLESAHLPWYVRAGLVRSRLAAALAAPRRPFLVRRGNPSGFQKVLVCVRDARAQREVLLAAIDLVRLSGGTLTALTVDVPKVTPVDGLDADLDRMARLYSVELTRRRASGDPVRQIRAAAADQDLVVLGFRPEHGRPFRPDVSTLLLHDLPVSALFVPWST